MTREDPMRYARRWMRSVGAFYLALLAPLTPPVVTGALPWLYPGLDLPPGGREAAALADAWLLVGLALATLGVLLLAGARRPAEHLPLIRLVIAWEVVVGLLAGVYVLARGLIAPGVALAALVPPPVIIVTGRIALRAARRERPGGPA
jgi:hypothetical protein